MAEDGEATALDPIRTSLEGKFSAFLETLTDDELALLRGDSEVEGFTFSLSAVSPTTLVSGSSVIAATTQDTTVNKAKVSDKVATASDGYLRS